MKSDEKMEETKDAHAGGIAFRYMIVDNAKAPRCTDTMLFKTLREVYNHLEAYYPSRELSRVNVVKALILDDKIELTEDYKSKNEKQKTQE